jgi:hypothetical protein
MPDALSGPAAQSAQRTAQGRRRFPKRTVREYLGREGPVKITTTAAENNGEPLGETGQYGLKRVPSRGRAGIRRRNRGSSWLSLEQIFEVPEPIVNRFTAQSQDCSYEASSRAFRDSKILSTKLLTEGQRGCVRWHLNAFWRWCERLTSVTKAVWRAPFLRSGPDRRPRRAHCS